MVLHVLRAIFVLSVLAISISYATTPEILRAPGAGETGFSPVTKVTLVLVIPVALAFLLIMVDMGFRQKSLGALSGLFFGLVAGISMAYILGMVVDLIANVFVPGKIQSSQLVAMIKLLVGALAVYLCVSFVMQTKDDFRFIIPYVEFAKQSKGIRPMLLDTSVIIDGRIADIAETRILESPLVVPRFVLEELQEVADSSDKLKRNRGRRGLDILNRLQKSSNVEVRLLDARVAAVEEAEGVDQKLLAMAQHLGARVVTNDYNLNKIAQLRGVEVMNINDLANALKPVFLPGEHMTVKIVKHGEEAGQGIGYLDDGTMVVVEQGREHVGQEVQVLITSMLQTSAGRMVFGRMGGDGGADNGTRGRGRPS